MTIGDIGPQTVGPRQNRTWAESWEKFRVKSKSKLWIGIALVVIVLVAIAIPLANKYWPYRYRNVKPLLESVFASHITIAHYHRVYFPHPGFVADGLTLRRDTAPDLPPIGTVRELRVEGNWVDLLLLRSRVRLIYAKGLHVVIPPPGSRANREDFPAGASADFAGPTTSVETLHMQDALMEIVHVDGSRAAYSIHDLALHGVHKAQAARYVVDMQNAKPKGHIQSSGSFGPLLPSNLGGTPLSGDIVFAPVNLGDIGTLHGTLSSKGHFSGRLADIEATITAATPNFAVSDGQPVGITGSAQLTVNGLNGNVVLHTIDLRTGETMVHAGGTVMGSPRSTDLDVDVEKGRAQDLLHPFLHDAVPITGVVWLKSHAHVAPGDRSPSFLQRLAVQGTLSLPAEQLTDHEMGKTLTAFSARAQGAGSKKGDPGDPSTASADVVSSLQAQVKVRNGIVSTGRLTFAVPGAVVTLKGTYALHTGAVHLTGDLKMDSDISHATTGFKSVLLKPLALFFKKKKAGAVVTIAVTGVPNHYKVSQNILHTK